MKKIALVFCLLSIFSASVFAQVSADPTDEFYDLVERWEIEGVILEQPPLRPYPLQKIEEILTTVIESDNEYEAGIAEDYYERTFRRPFKVNVRANGNVRLGSDTPSDENWMDKQLIFGLGAAGDYAFRDFVSAGYDLNVYGTNNITLDAVPQYSAQPYYFRDSVDIKSLKAYWIMDATFAGSYEDVYGQIGVNHLSFGPFYKKSAQVSPDAKHTANFSFVYAGERLSYTQALFGLSASNAKKDIDDLFSKKFLAIHSLNGQIFPWLNASFYEVTIYGDRFEPAYLIPMPFIITQALSGFDDNTFMGISFTVRPIPGFVWVNDLFMDDAGLGDLIQLDFDTKLQCTFQSAFKFSPVNVGWIDKIQLDYTMVSPYMYTHKQNLIDPATGNWNIGTLGVINYQEYTTAGDPLGLSLPPNTERIGFSASFTPVKKLKLSIHGNYIRHANINESLPEDEILSYLNSPEGYFVTDGGIHNHQHVLTGGDPEKVGAGNNTYLDSAWNHFNFLTQDTQMHTYQAGFDVEYLVTTQKYGSLSLSAGYMFEKIYNYGVDKEIFKAKGPKDNFAKNYDIVKDADGKEVKVWRKNADEGDIKKSLESWRANLRNVVNNYFFFGIKYTW